MVWAKTLASEAWSSITRSMPITGSVVAATLPPVCVDHGVRGQHSAQSLQIAAAGGHEECFGELQSALLGKPEPRACFADMFTGAHRELTTGSRFTADSFRDSWKLTPKKSGSRKAARSSGERRSRASISGSVTSSQASSGSSTIGSGSQGPR